MPCRLIDLALEIQTKIADELLNDTKNCSEDSERDEKDPYYCRLEKPDEKAARHRWERKKLRIQDLMNWSCTSVFFRDMLAPYIFETISLRNEDRSGSSVTTLSQSRHSKLVRKLMYAGSIPKKIYRNTTGILPDSVATLLSNLKSFQNLETLSIEFPYCYTHYNEWVDGHDIVAQDEEDSETEDSEDNIAWRALMVRTYVALVQNEGTPFKALEIRELVPPKLSTFTTKAFHSFLGRLERFSFSVFGEDNDVGWTILKRDEYVSLTSKLDEFFFDRLVSVTEFTLKASEEGPLGLTGWCQFPLALNKDQMPSLKKCSLEYVFVGQELVTFLVGHAKTLESVSIRECSASVDGSAEEGISWSVFFDSLYAANFKSLRELVITPVHSALMCDDTGDQEEDEANVSSEIQEVRRILKFDDTRRVFSYTTIDDACIFDVDEGENVAAFHRGEDQASYERLMSRISANAAKHQGTYRVVQ